MASQPLWATVVLLAVPTVTAFIVAYLHRKQMRQVELYRRDPTAGLVPPPAALTRFVKNHWSLILGTVFPVFFVAIELMKVGPVSRPSAFLISFNVALLIANWVLEALFRITGKIMEVLGVVAELATAQGKSDTKTLELQGHHIELTKSTVDLMSALIQETAQLAGVSTKELEARLTARIASAKIDPPPGSGHG